MAIERLEYELSESAMSSIDQQTVRANSGSFRFMNESQKGRAFLMIHGTNSKLNYIVPEKHDGLQFACPIPKPSSLFLGQARLYAKMAVYLQSQFQKSVYFTLHNNPDVDADVENNLHLVDQNIYYPYLIHKIGCITALVSAVECHINESIPEGFTIRVNKNQVIDKEHIERRWSIQKKLDKLVPQMNATLDLNLYNLSKNAFVDIKNIRNEFTHLKTKLTPSNQDPFVEQFEELINLDLSIAIEKTVQLIQLIHD